MLTDLPQSFTMYARCSIEYDGRAYSTLECGNYLIIYKADRSFLVHGADLCVPRNYMGPKSTIHVDNDNIIVRNKSEKIIVNITDIHSITDMSDWSSDKIKISKTEKELVDKLCSNAGEYVGGQFREIIREYQTDYGPIDIVCIDCDGMNHVIEVKRKKATVTNVTQLLKYLNHFVDNSISHVGYIASPDIAGNAEKYLMSLGMKWIKVEF